MVSEKTVRQLEGTEWTDTYEASKGRVKVENIVERITTDGLVIEQDEFGRDSDYLAIEISRLDHENRSMVGVDFLEYVSLGRFEPVDESAKAVSEQVSEVEF